MRWQVHLGDILDVPADVLICSANVYLTLSGGVGGAFLLRYGPTMQTALECYLRDRGIRHVEQGDVVCMPPCGSPYQAVLHAVAVDGFYQSSANIVATVLGESLRRAAALEAHTVAVTAVATGYGRMSMPEFAVGLQQVIGKAFPPVDCVSLGLRSPEDVEQLLVLIPELTTAEGRGNRTS
jgi:O-acetyl-ADP-ribose deacetylase (regulator of RNase III)